MVKKCRGISEVTVMEVAQVGVRTRAQAALGSEATRSRSTERRKVGKGKLEVSGLLNVRTRLVKTEENMFSFMRAAERNSVWSECSRRSSDQAAASCCSSNGSVELQDDRIDCTELEAVSAEVEPSTYNDGDERRETTPTSQLPAETVSNGVEPTIGKTEETSPRRLIPSKIPTDPEIEEFFISAEEDLRKRFADKYNYDIVKDKQLEGRYEWTRLTP